MTGIPSFLKRGLTSQIAGRQENNDNSVLSLNSFPEFGAQNQRTAGPKDFAFPSNPPSPP